MNGDLTHLGGEDDTFHTHDITDIHAFEIFVCFLTQVIACNVALDIAL